MSEEVEDAILVAAWARRVPSDSLQSCPGSVATDRVGLVATNSNPNKLRTRIGVMGWRNSSAVSNGARMSLESRMRRRCHTQGFRPQIPDSPLPSSQLCCCGLVLNLVGVLLYFLLHNVLAAYRSQCRRREGHSTRHVWFNLFVDRPFQPRPIK
uniref:Uncharacterized protein n=1 Tax=Spongospora subterranea TaxID=70186 RepID=A0A0H5QL60_9EUKA|eukprot:CRZ02852.1 hypothetical protein [Spongospora subterranea]